MGNEVERLDFAIEFAKQAYERFCKMRDQWSAVEEHVLFISSISQTYLDSKCRDCGHSPTGRTLNDEPEWYSI